MIEAWEVHQIIRTLTEPARRHKCGVCQEIFECHLCTMEEEHPLHWEGGKTDFYCLSCITSLGLTVGVTGQMRDRVKTQCGEYRRFGRDMLRFYDQVTGELLGTGTVRRYRR